MTTYLCVKRHNKTGLKYFCKTTRKGYDRYAGSGVEWRKHLKEHGWDFTTIQVWQYEDQDECSRFAVDFSVKNNIVKSKEWANKKIETGKDGGSEKGHKKSPRTKEHTENHRKSVTGIKNPAISISNSTRVVTEESNQKRRTKLTGTEGWSTGLTKETDERIANMAKSKLGKSFPVVTCPHCNKQGGGGVMNRYHFDNCREK